MNAKFELEVLSQDSNEVVEAFKIEGGAQQLFNRIADQARSIVPDLSTDKSRKEIASVARKVASTKTAFDAHGKALKEQYTVITDKIDADRKLFRDQCDALRDEVRKPLTDWEDAEKQRKLNHEQKISVLKCEYFDYLNADSAFLKEMIEKLDSKVIDSSYEEYEDQAKIAKYESLETLRKTLVAREKYEAEQAALEALRLAEQARIQAERDAQIAREATEKAQHEAEEKARLEAERVQCEKLEAEQREARLKAEKEAAELRAVQAAENERKRIEAEQLAKAEADRKAEEARLANVEHRRVINREAFDAIQALCLGIPEAQIKELIGAIAKNQVPHVSIKY